MSFAEDTDALERSFVTTGELLERLLKALQQRRAAWVSIRPDVLAPGTEIEQLSHALAQQEHLRDGLLGRIRDALPSPAGKRPETLHLNVTRIAAAMPTERGRALRAAADAVVPLAKQVRAETTLGQRLLRFAKSAQTDVDAELIGAAKAARAPGYDRGARTINGPNAAGQLVDGRM